MGQARPPTRSSLEATQCLIGKDRYGNWVVRGPRGIYGGRFVNRVDALRFAMLENGNRPQAVVMVPSTLELNVT